MTAHTIRLALLIALSLATASSAIVPAFGHEEQTLRPGIRPVHTYSIDRNWATLVPHLPPSGLLPDDERVIARILAAGR